jgi:hypothetical protein
MEATFADIIIRELFSRPMKAMKKSKATVAQHAEKENDDAMNSRFKPRREIKLLQVQVRQFIRPIGKALAS